MNAPVNDNHRAHDAGADALTCAGIYVAQMQAIAGAAGFHPDMPYATYADYLASPVWAAIRARKLAAAGNRCQTCDSPHNLEVHHRRYGVWGAEDMRDLVALCSLCHELFTVWQARRAEIITDIERRVAELETMP